MSGLEVALERLADDLDLVGARWAVVGGLAVSARAEPRMTRDVDVAVATADDGAAERLVVALLGRGHRLSMVLEHEPSGRLATVRLVVPGPSPVVGDLLFSSCGIEDRVVDAATPIAVTARRDMPVASVGHLIAMKLLSEGEDRPRDRQDLLALCAVASGPDLEVAREACAEISERGFGRSRDLVAALAALVAGHGSVRGGLPPR